MKYMKQVIVLLSVIVAGPAVEAMAAEMAHEQQVQVELLQLDMVGLKLMLQGIDNRHKAGLLSSIGLRGVL